MGDPVMELFAEFAFEAAHQLPLVPPEHPCARMHGHSYQVKLSLVGPVDPTLGWVMDFATITAAFEPLRACLDHHVLNEVPGLENPTSETLARWLWDRLLGPLPLLSSVEVRETRTMGCIYRGAR
jgi:6-pyruvoyltetrahydropterin/6-carboxytetrahydropterin synthase